MRVIELRQQPYTASIISPARRTATPSLILSTDTTRSLLKDVVGMCTSDKPFKELKILCHQETWSAYCRRGTLHPVGNQTRLHIQSYIGVVVGLQVADAAVSAAVKADVKKAMLLPSLGINGSTSLSFSGSCFSTM